VRRSKARPILEEVHVSLSEATTLACRFLGDASGATAIEYGLIAAGIGATISGVVWSLGSEIQNTLYGRLTALF